MALDPEGSSLSFTVLGLPAGEIQTLSPDGGRLLYTPPVGLAAPDQLTFVANDGELDSNVATVSFTSRPADFTQSQWQELWNP